MDLTVQEQYSAVPLCTINKQSNINGEVNSVFHGLGAGPAGFLESSG